MDEMCGRVIQASPPDQLGLKIIDALDPRDNRVPGDPFGNVPPRYNGAPSQQLWVIRQHPETGQRSLDLLQWGLIPTGARTSRSRHRSMRRRRPSTDCRWSEKGFASAAASSRSTAFNTHGWGAQMSIILGAVYLLASGLVNRAMLKCTCL